MDKKTQQTEFDPEGDVESLRSGNNSIMKPDSPCIGMCSTSYGDSICRGCGRSSDEVIGWIFYDDEKKKEVWDRVELEGTAVRFRPAKSTHRP